MFQLAAGAERSSLQFEVSSTSGHHRMAGISLNKTRRRTIEVEVVPLDYLIAERNIPVFEPIVVRMDIEGYEGHAFKGMQDLLASERPCYVFVEIHPFEPLGNVVDSLQSSGFELEYTSLDRGGTSAPASPSWDDLRDIDRPAHIMASRL